MPAMMVRYTCDRCGRIVGELHIAGTLGEEEVLARLGLSGLSPDQREELLWVEEDGRSLRVASLCESCLSAAGSLVTGTVL